MHVNEVSGVFALGGSRPGQSSPAGASPDPSSRAGRALLAAPGAYLLTKRRKGRGGVDRGLEMLCAQFAPECCLTGSRVLPWMRSSKTFMPTPLPRLVVGIPEDTRQQLRALAAAHHRNISGEVIAALESWIAMHSQADRAATAAGSLVKSWIAREAAEASSTEEG